MKILRTLDYSNFNQKIRKKNTDAFDSFDSTVQCHRITNVSLAKISFQYSTLSIIRLWIENQKKTYPSLWLFRPYSSRSPYHERFTCRNHFRIFRTILSIASTNRMRKSRKRFHYFFLISRYFFSAHIYLRRVALLKMYMPRLVFYLKVFNTFYRLVSASFISQQSSGNGFTVRRCSLSLSNSPFTFGTVFDCCHFYSI